MAKYRIPKVKVEFETENAYFRNSDESLNLHAVEQTLQEAFKTMVRGVLPGVRRGVLKDANGNVCGKWRMD